MPRPLFNFIGGTPSVGNAGRLRLGFVFIVAMVMVLASRHAWAEGQVSSVQILSKPAIAIKVALGISGTDVVRQ